eukprot:1568845-Pleurochrysis_carterae.AAC.1
MLTRRRRAATALKVTHTWTLRQIRRQWSESRCASRRARTCSTSASRSASRRRSRRPRRRATLVPRPVPSAR